MSNLGISNFGISNATAGGLVDFTFVAVVASAMGPVLDLICSWAVDLGEFADQPRRPVREASPSFVIPGAERGTQVEAPGFSDQYSKVFGALQ
jgi:hypothetical protein